MSTYQSLIRAFVDDEANSQLALAAEIGKSQAAVNRYANGLRFPDAETARAIERATGGQVPFSAWQQEAAARIGIEPPQDRAA
ncbi:helix-turn-helix domain-containing protein [Sphingobium sp. SYK-6]|uniref:helix-turn-helix domain-containing protein n=1 Tax=Sphingobium sp. (strain NBRC 103272 / SYK-6) TaxID=627192 RepID=UPI001E5A6048|nr:helix-turn-helix domain-containing protein [Sphingobium sp. SYK-6]